MLHYQVIENGKENVVFLHGFLEDSTMWNGLTTDLPFRIILIDLPGHGKSKPINSSEITLFEFAESVTKIIEKECQSTSFSIVGHSLGGYVALELLKQERVKPEKTILFHSHPWADSEAKKAERLKVVDVIKTNKKMFLNVAIPHLFYKPELYSSEISHLISSAMEMDSFSIAATTLAMRNRGEYLEVLEKNKEEICVIQGEKDNLIPFHKMKNLYKKIKFKGYFLEGVGHMSHIESPKEIVRIFKQELKS